MLQVLLRQERHVTTVGGSGLMVREGKVRIVKMRRDHSNRGAGSRPLGLPDADASHREDASPEDKASQDGHAAVAVAPKGERRLQRRTSGRLVGTPRARALLASGRTPAEATMEGGERVREGRGVAKHATS